MRSAGGTIEREWRRIHRMAAWLGRCVRCGVSMDEGATECERGHTRTEARVSKPRGVTSLDVTRAYEIAERLESEVMGVVDDLLTRLRVCGECGHPRERHVGEAGACGGCIGVRKSEEVCKEFVWTVTVGEIVGSLDYIRKMTRHSERLDADLGLDVKKVAVVGSPIVTALEARGWTLEKMRKLSPTERADLMLEVRRGLEGPVVEAEVVSREETPE